MKTFKHLSLEEREKITILQCEGLSIRSIASILDRSASTISRELKRAETVYFRGRYIGSQTHKKVIKNWREKHKRVNYFLRQKNIVAFIKSNLQYGYTPEIISNILKRKYSISISHETIYKYIYSTNSKLGLTKYLLRRKYGRISRDIRMMNRLRYKNATGKNIPNRIDIDLRSNLANQRIEFGHFEADSIEGTRKRRKQNNRKKHIQQRKSCLTIMVDRTTRLTKIMKTASKTAQATTTSIISALKPYSLINNNNTIKSITYDNGYEFSQHEIINKELQCKSYFCKPYHSWEKGTVENINGLIRRFFPKGVNFDNVLESDIQYVEDWINNRPMKVLNYLTPYEKCKELGVAISC